MEDNEHVDYRQGAIVKPAVAPEDLPSRRVDDEPDQGSVENTGAGKGARNVSRATPRDAALESARSERSE